MSDENEKAWANQLRAYGYSYTDDFDFLLAESVKSGFFNEAKFRSKAIAKNKEIKAQKADGAFSKAWKLYHNSFDNNGEKVVNTIYEGFKEGGMYITPLNLNGTVSLLRDLGEDEKASELIDLYIEKRKGEIEIFNVEEDIFGNIKDTEIIEKFNAMYEEAVPVENIKQVLSRLSKSNGWSQNDEKVLVSASVDDYFHFFKSENGALLRGAVSACLRFGQFSNATQQQKSISKAASAALHKIASESEINQRRVRGFGVDV